MTAAELSRVLRFWTFRPDISFLPQPERLKPEEYGYYTWDYVWLVPGKEAEFEALNIDWIALSAARKSRDPFMTYQGGSGTRNRSMSGSSTGNRPRTTPWPRRSSGSPWAMRARRSPSAPGP